MTSFFRSLYSVFGSRTYDCLEEEDKRFLKDHKMFMSQVWMLDRKIGRVLSRAFDDCTVSSSILKLLKIFGDVTFRLNLQIFQQPLILYPLRI